VQLADPFGFFAFLIHDTLQVLVVVSSPSEWSEENVSGEKTPIGCRHWKILCSNDEVVLVVVPSMTVIQD
jgi:hypothetical protein